MGLKDFFERRRVGRQARTVERMTKSLQNPYGQAQERKRAISILAEINSDDAIRGLLTRFAHTSEKSIVDEDEKETIFDLLLEKGERCVPLIEEYLRANTAIFWPLKLLRRLAGEVRTVDLLLEMIDAIPEEFVETKLLDRKLSLISQLREFQDPRILERLTRWVGDAEEEIRFHAVDAIVTYPGNETTTLLVERLLDQGETARIKNFVLDMLIQNKWPVKAHRKELRDHLPTDFWVDDTGVVQRKR
jgi:HEAT repeat protein